MGYNTELVIRRIEDTLYNLNNRMSISYDQLPSEFQEFFLRDLARFAASLEDLVGRFASCTIAAQNVARGSLELPEGEETIGWMPVDGIPVWHVFSREILDEPTEFTDYAPPPDEVEIVVYLDEYNGEQLEAVERAAFVVADELGYSDFALMDEQLGSIFRKFVGKFKSGLTSDHVQQKMRELDIRASIEITGRAQAQNDAIKTASAVNLIASLSDIPNAVVRVGGLLILKRTSADGVPVAIVRELSMREVRALESNPGIQKDPHRALELLALAVAQLEDQEP